MPVDFPQSNPLTELGSLRFLNVFARQWMHYAFPRHCDALSFFFLGRCHKKLTEDADFLTGGPFPHVSGTTKRQSLTQFQAVPWRME